MAWQRAASLDDLRSARPWLPVRVGRKALVVAAAGDGWSAFDDSCAHAGCPFSTDGELIGDMIVCRCHGSEYDVATGEVVRGPAEYPIRTYPVRVVGTDVEVDL